MRNLHCGIKSKIECIKNTINNSIDSIFPARKSGANFVLFCGKNPDLYKINILTY